MAEAEDIFNIQIGTLFYEEGKEIKKGRVFTNIYTYRSDIYNTKQNICCDNIPPSQWWRCTPLQGHGTIGKKEVL